MTSPLLTTEQVERLLDIWVKRPDRDGLLAHDAALRAKITQLQNALQSIEKDAKQMREASHE